MSLKKLIAMGLVAISIFVVGCSSYTIKNIETDFYVADEETYDRLS